METVLKGTSSLATLKLGPEKIHIAGADIAGFIGSVEDPDALIVTLDCVLKGIFAPKGKTSTWIVPRGDFDRCAKEQATPLECGDTTVHLYDTVYIYTGNDEKFIAAVDELEHLEERALAANRRQFNEFIESIGTASMEDVPEDVKKELATLEKADLPTLNHESFSRLCVYFLKSACKRGATSVSLDWDKDFLNVRFLIDGVWNTALHPSRKLALQFATTMYDFVSRLNPEAGSNPTFDLPVEKERARFCITEYQTSFNTEKDAVLIKILHNPLEQETRKIAKEIDEALMSMPHVPDSVPRLTSKEYITGYADDNYQRFDERDGKHATPAAHLTSIILRDAAKRKTTQIKISCAEDELSVSYCIDDRWYVGMRPPTGLKDALFQELCMRSRRAHPDNGEPDPEFDLRLKNRVAGKGPVTILFRLNGMPEFAENEMIIDIIENPFHT